MQYLPLLNATLNLTCSILLMIGLVLILKKKRKLHMRVMWTAFGFSVAFLISYLIYHFQVGDLPFQGKGIIRPIYFTILISHITLAVVIVPMVLITLYRGTKKRYAKHRKIAHWTWPIWMYVSVTGVIIYLMMASSGSYNI